jgi:hypothetical protein
MWPYLPCHIYGLYELQTLLRHVQSVTVGRRRLFSLQSSILFMYILVSSLLCSLMTCALVLFICLVLLRRNSLSSLLFSHTWFFFYFFYSSKPKTLELLFNKVTFTCCKVGQYPCCVVLWVLKYFRITHLSVSVFGNYFQNQRVVGSGCFKNLEESIVFLETINKELVVLWLVLGHCDVFENHSYIPKPILWLFWYPMGYVGIDRADGHEPNCGLEPTWFSCKESARYNSRWYPTWYPNFKAYTLGYPFHKELGLVFF